MLPALIAIIDILSGVSNGIQHEQTLPHGALFLCLSSRDCSVSLPSHDADFFAQEGIAAFGRGFGWAATRSALLTASQVVPYAPSLQMVVGEGQDFEFRNMKGHSHGFASFSAHAGFRKICIAASRASRRTDTRNLHRERLVTSF